MRAGHRAQQFSPCDRFWANRAMSANAERFDPPTALSGLRRGGEWLPVYRPLAGLCDIGIAQLARSKGATARIHG